MMTMAQFKNTRHQLFKKKARTRDPIFVGHTSDLFIIVWPICTVKCDEGEIKFKRGDILEQFHFK